MGPLLLPTAKIPLSLLEQYSIEGPLTCTQTLSRRDLVNRSSAAK